MPNDRPGSHQNSRSDRPEPGLRTLYPHYRDITLRPREIRRIGAPDEHYMLREIDPGVVIESENGTYDKRSADVSESAHAFTGQIAIQNTTDLTCNVQFLQVIYVQKAVTPGVTPL